MHAIAHEGCTDTVRESELKVNPLRQCVCMCVCALVCLYVGVGADVFVCGCGCWCVCMWVWVSFWWCGWVYTSNYAS